MDKFEKRIKELETQVEGLKYMNNLIRHRLIPKGWKLVPIVPTNEMRIAFFEALDVAYKSQERPAKMPWIEAYNAMLETAPEPKAN